MLATVSERAIQLSGGIPMSDVQPRSVNAQAGDGGQTLAEYALILSLIAILAILSLLFVGGQINNLLSTIGNAL
jgi:Flp pilus assembly pilin Flp